MVDHKKRAIENLEKAIGCARRAERNRELDKIKDEQEKSAFNAAINILTNILGEITKQATMERKADTTLGGVSSLPIKK